MEKRIRPAVLLPLILLLFVTLFHAYLLGLEKAERFQDAYRWQPWRGDLLEKAGFAAFAEADYDTAIASFLQARQNGALSAAGQRNLAEAYLQSGQPELALQEWEALLQNGLADEEILLTLSAAYHQRGDFEREAQILQRGIQSAPQNAEFHWRMGLLKLAEAPLEAFPFFERVQALDPQPGYPLRELILTLDRAILADSAAYRLTVSAQSLAALGEWQLARQGLERAVQADPAYAPAWGLLGEARQQTGSDQALPALQKSLQLDPTSASVYAYLGLYWQRRNDFVRASQAFRQALQWEPDNPVWWLNLGELAYRQGNLPDSYTYYLRATEIAPQDAGVWRALALFCLQTEGCLEQDGRPAALKAHSLEQDNWLNSDTLGQVLMALGHDVDARFFYERAIRLAPGQVAPRYHLGLLDLRQGEGDSARQNLQTALELDPNGPLAGAIRSVLERYLP